MTIFKDLSHQARANLNVLAIVLLGAVIVGRPVGLSITVGMSIDLSISLKARLPTRTRCMACRSKV